VRLCTRRHWVTDGFKFLVLLIYRSSIFLRPWAILRNYQSLKSTMITSSPRSNKIWKGKQKAGPPQDFDDLDPIITYRHILSNNLGVRDPLRVIALCDSDAFYAACEMVRLGVDSETPLVVLQWDSLIAVNYPARKYGISRMDKKDALERCPHLVVVHVATYREGEKEPGYWDDVDTNTHKARWFTFLYT